MSNKLNDVQTRIGSVHELEAVVSAMRGIAAARTREARGRLEGIRACASMIGAAIGDALMLDDRSEPAARPDASAERQVMIILCAEQGFVGTFNDHVIAVATSRIQVYPTEYFVIGDRGLAVAAEHGLKISWSAPMVVHADEVPVLANRITEALYARLESGRATRVNVLHAAPQLSAAIEIVEQALLPFNFRRFPKATRRLAPLVTLPPQRLLLKLAEEYIFAQLCEAILLSFAAENEARMRAMIAARTNVHDTLDQLIGDFRRLRQEEITSEIVELASGSLVVNDSRQKRRSKS